MKKAAAEASSKSNNGGTEAKGQKKPQFRPAIDDTKPILKDPILRSDPIETEEAVLRLPPFPIDKLKKSQKFAS
ncbi:unnamed protein product [Coffea canephora]|uniref:Uncharacterized protein n=1 Tax=Coffea canephora TaxID=49390 RepID=A0A068UXY5_COFCA|nr:unnamed protein product [Coffea canephora]